MRSTRVNRKGLRPASTNQTTSPREPKGLGAKISGSDRHTQGPSEMLLILMYHRAVDCRLGNSVPVLRAHFAHLRERCNVVLPGEPLLGQRLNVCLSFDDAYADFHGLVFPLLEELSLHALLAVPTAFVIEKTGRGLEERLSVSPDGDAAMQGGVFKEKAPFCTWEELREIASSGLVRIASHGHSHADLTRADVNVEFEASHSKALLERRLGVPVSTFVYPFGRVNRRSHAAVKREFAYAMRIGSALNTDWRPVRQPLCRVVADAVPDIVRLLSRASLARFEAKWAANRIRAAFGKWEPW
ncbi:MAG: polysaccharide deacetylase family protein [Acidobacteriia bacterium]|nr:polysaccharide deacetylase family protein [Terriglobia bacterium]